MPSIIAWSIYDRTKTKTTMEKNGIHNGMSMYANVHNAELKFSLKLRQMPIKMEKNVRALYLTIARHSDRTMKDEKNAIGISIEFID